MVGHAGQAGVHIATAQVFGTDDFAGGGLHQGRAPQKDGALILDDDGLVTHGRHVCSACGATAHDHGDLGQALGAHVGLVVKNAAKVVPIREHLVLIGQVGTTRVHQVNARQVVLLGDLLRAQMLFDGHGEISAAFDRGVVAHHHAVGAVHTPDAGDQTGRRGIVVVHVQRRQWGDFQKRRAGIQQLQQPVAGQQLAAPGVLGASRLAAPQCDLRLLLSQIFDQRLHGVGIGLKVGRTRIE